MKTKTAAMLLFPASAWAHHFMESELPRSFAQGLLSGLGHPIVGLDHAAFIVAAGFLLALCRNGTWGVGALVLGSLGGAALHLAGAGLAGGEIGVALSVVLVGALVAARRALPLWAVLLTVGGAGVLHGHAYAESIFGAEPAPLAAYLAGFSLIQLAVAGAALVVHRQLMHRKEAAAVVGGATGAVGLFFLVA